MIQFEGGLEQFVGLITVILVVAQPFKEVATNIIFVPIGISVIESPFTEPNVEVTLPLLIYSTEYVDPLQIALLIIRSGAILFGDKIVITCGPHPEITEVIITDVPIGIPIIALVVTIPTEEVIIALFGLLMLIE
jgi:hypothetical protein